MAFWGSKCLWSCAESSYLNLKLVQHPWIIQTCCPRRYWTMPYSELKDVNAWLVHLLVGSIQSRPCPTPKCDHILSIYMAARELCSPHDPRILQMTLSCGIAIRYSGIAAWEFLSDSTLVPWTRVDRHQHAERTKSLEEQHPAWLARQWPSVSIWCGNATHEASPPALKSSHRI